MKKILVIIMVIVIGLMPGCTKQKEVSELKGIDINALLTEIDQYTTEKKLEPSKEPLACYAESYDMNLKWVANKIRRILWTFTKL